MLSVLWCNEIDKNPLNENSLWCSFFCCSEILMVECEVIHEHEQQKQSEWTWQLWCLFRPLNNCTFHSVFAFLLWCMFIYYKNSRAKALSKINKCLKSEFGSDKSWTELRKASERWYFLSAFVALRLICSLRRAFLSPNYISRCLVVKGTGFEAT